jgi:SAM-dependent methyltransferase
MKDLKRLKEHYEVQGRESSFDVYLGPWGLKSALFKRRREVIKDVLPKKPGIALDVGCGLGVYSLDLCLFGYEVLAIDISKSYLEKCKILKSRVGKEWHLILADAQNLPLRKGCLDLLLCSEVLEHVPDMLKALVEMIKLLKRGGILVLSIPSRFSFTEALGVVREHLHKVNPIWLRNTLCKSGFLCVEERFCNFAIYPVMTLLSLKRPSLESFVIVFWLGLDKLIGMIPFVKLICWCYVAKL